MKLNSWIGPLLGVIFLLSLRQMIDNDTKNEQQRSDISATIIKQQMDISPPMTGTRKLVDSLPLWCNYQHNKAAKQMA